MRTPKPNIRALTTTKSEMPPVSGRRPTITPSMMTHPGELGARLPASGLPATVSFTLWYFSECEEFS